MTSPFDRGRDPRVGPDQQYRVANPMDPRRFIFTDGVHLVIDGERPVELLHQFAARIGLKPQWFQGDHYDLTTPLAAERAVGCGATLIDMRCTARIMKPKGHPLRPEGFEPEVLGTGAPAAKLAREKHGDVMEFIQGPGNRSWLGKRNNHPWRDDPNAPRHHRVASPRIITA